jgi:uncharacterized protein
MLDPTSHPPAMPLDAELQAGEAAVIAAMRAWLEVAVIGLNLCPFARAVHVRGGIRWVVSKATTPMALAEDLARELMFLSETDPAHVDTTLLVHPGVFQDFDDFNDFLDIADGLLDSLDLVGAVQIASFHPDYRFEGESPDDVSNATNRAPYPALHLLREDSVTRAVDAVPDPDAIPARNLDTLRRLGASGWASLSARFRPTKS